MTPVKKAFTSKFKNLARSAGTGNRTKIKKSFSELHPRDQAEYFFDLDPKTRHKLYSHFTQDEVADLFESLDLDDRVQYMPELSTKYGAGVLSEMHADDAVDVLSQLGPAKASNYLALMDRESAQELSGMLSYEEDHAGSIMTTEFISVHEKTTAGEALEVLKREAQDAVTIYYIFVTDDKDKLVRVSTMKELILADKDRPVSDLGPQHVVSVKADESKEYAAEVMKDYNLLALPVVNYYDKLLGIITIDDIVDLIDEQAAEDYSRLAAAADLEITDPAFKSAWKRLPWLILLLFFGILTASLIGQFESTIAQVAILGAFIPVVAGTTGNSGTQALAIMVRGIANDSISKLTLHKYFMKELVTALTTSLICGVVLMGIIYVWKGEAVIGVVAGLSLSMSIFVGTLVGSAIPLILRKIKIDPAVASGPLITTVCDIISMAIYFGIATILLSYLV